MSIQFMTTRKCGFTLIELAVVLAIVGCFCLLGLPALAKTQNRGVNIACRNNQRTLMQAFQMYADANDSYFPGNVDYNPGSPGWNWVTDTFNDPPAGTRLLNPAYSLLAPYLPQNPKVFRCPASLVAIASGSERTSRARTVSMNQAVGTKPDSGAYKNPVDGPWLDGTHGHQANRRWYCYGKTSDLILPNPANLWVILDEHDDSINDGAFANIGPGLPTLFIDWPATYHQGGGMFGFADGHVQQVRWLDNRTLATRPSGIVNQPNNVDITWIANHSTAPVKR